MACPEGCPVEGLTGFAAGCCDGDGELDWAPDCRALARRKRVGKDTGNPKYRNMFFIRLVLKDWIRSYLFYSYPILFYSHSIVAGGLLLISYTTRLIPLTLLMISLEISARNE